MFLALESLSRRSFALFAFRWSTFLLDIKAVGDTCLPATCILIGDLADPPSSIKSSFNPGLSLRPLRLFYNLSFSFYESTMALLSETLVKCLIFSAINSLNCLCSFCIYFYFFSSSCSAIIFSLINSFVGSYEYFTR